MAHWRNMWGTVLVLGLAAGLLLGGIGTPWAAEEPARDAAISTPAAGAGAAATVVFTREIADGIKDMKIAMDTIWVLVTAFLVFFMNLGFAMVESGLCRAKNAVNILSKNFIVFAVSSLAFLLYRLGLDVRRRERLFRHARTLVRERGR